MTDFNSKMIIILENKWRLKIFVENQIILVF
jgi:hypothetical protein